MHVAVDLVILTIKQDQLCALIIRRGIEPYMGRWALPGGFVRDRESLDAAAFRELLEETGIDRAHVGHMEQLATFGAPARDPRGRVVSVAYLALVPNLPAPSAGGDANAAEVAPTQALLAKGGRLAFDHDDILSMGIERARAKLEYTPLATAFCEKEFTIQDLRKVYESVWGAKLDPANFHRKVTKTAGFVSPTPTYLRGESGRPAQVYIRGDAVTLYPPLLRASS